MKTAAIKKKKKTWDFYYLHVLFT